MKKIIWILATTSMANLLWAQSFTGNSLLIHLNAGIEAYNTEFEYKIRNTNFDTLIKDQAGNANYFLGLEYGPLKWLGIGIKTKLNKYFTEKDKITGYTPTANSFDIAFTIRAHLFRRPHFDLPIGISVGGSKLTYNNNNPNDPVTIEGTGSYFDLHIQPMLYFKRFGANLYLGIPSVNYTDMSFSNTGLNQYVISNWKGKGIIIIGVGLQYRILN